MQVQLFGNQGAAMESGMTRTEPHPRTSALVRPGKTLLLRPDDNPQAAASRNQARTSRPLASGPFVAELEKQLGKRLRALPEGRQPRAAVATEASAGPEWR